MFVGRACTRPAVLILCTVKVIVVGCIAQGTLTVPQFAACLSVGSEAEVEVLIRESGIEAISKAGHV